MISSGPAHLFRVLSCPECTARREWEPLVARTMAIRFTGLSSRRTLVIPPDARNPNGGDSTADESEDLQSVVHEVDMRAPYCVHAEV